MPVRHYRFFQAEDNHGRVVDVLVDEETFEDDGSNPTDYFVMSKINADTIEVKGTIEMDGPNVDSLPDILGANDH